MIGLAWMLRSRLLASVRYNPSHKKNELINVLEDPTEMFSMIFGGDAFMDW